MENPIDPQFSRSLVVELNNGALTHFLKGDFDKAVLLLHMAYESYQSCRDDTTTRDDYSSGAPRLVEPMVGVPFNSAHRSRRYSTQVLNFVGYPKESNSQQEPENANSKQERDENLMDCDDFETTKDQIWFQWRRGSNTSFPPSPSMAYSMYNRGLVLSNDPAEEVLLRDHPHRTGAIILYNLALIHHNIGIHLGKSGALQGALRIYELAWETLDNDRRGPSSSSLMVKDIEKLLLALLNNMGNIHTYLFNSEQTQACMSDLRTVLAASRLALSMDEDYRFFYLNSVFQGKELHLSPAA